jgi:Ca2+-binding EF-hand superfamily protein
MNVTGRGLVVLLLLGSVVPGGQGLAQTAANPSCRADFESADRNGDGRLDRGEFHLRVVEQFFLLDRGRKGHLLVAELVGVSAEAFKAADRSADGKLTLQEFVNARFVDFVAADRNQDGSLTIEEIQTYSRC